MTRRTAPVHSQPGTTGSRTDRPIRCTAARHDGVASGPGITTESVVFNSAIHDFDLIGWLLDSPIIEAAWHAPQPSSHASGLDDPFLVLLRTADGALSTVECFVNARYGCDVVCETGVVSLAEPVRIVVGADQSSGHRLPEDWRPRFAEAYRLELQEWADSVREARVSTLASLEDGARAGQVADAVIASMRCGGTFVEVDR